MKIHLFYEGRLRSGNSADVAHKMALRRAFHPQLKTLWEEEAFEHFRTKPDVYTLDPDCPFASVTRLTKRVGDFTFLPIVSSTLKLTAALKLTLLRPSAPGGVLANSGDIDNQMKTLLDGLRVPSAPNEIPRNDSPQADESPIFCLFEDDRLVTDLSIETGRLLTPSADRNDVVVLIEARLGLSRAVMDSLHLALEN